MSKLYGLKTVFIKHKTIIIITSPIAIAIVMIGIHLATSSSSQPNNEVMAIALQSDGKVILGGKFTDNRILRKNTDGSDDENFTSSWEVGGFNQAVNVLSIQPDDKIIAGGDFTSFDTSIAGYIARLNSDGTLDTDFLNSSGTGFDDSVTAISLQPDEKILIGGKFTSYNGTEVNHIARLNPNGTLDTSFAPGDTGFDSAVLAIESLSDGGILVGGSFQSFQGSPSLYLLGLARDGSNKQFALRLGN
ncbi:MAG: delta-60 repeat domain-containing protein [Bdellovibrionota bacterium]